MSRHIVVVGDVLLDRDIAGTSHRLSPDAPVPVVDVNTVHTSPGGAGLAALLCARHGAGRAGRQPLTVTLLAPVADDDAGRQLIAGLDGIDVHALGHDGPTRTKTRIRSSGQTLLRIDDGGPGTPVDVDHAAIATLLAQANVILVSDDGGGTTRHETLRRAIAQAASSRPVVWDPHPRGGAPVPGCALVTPNLAEAWAAPMPSAHPTGHPVDPELARVLRQQWHAGAVVVTAGAQGAYLATLDAAELLPVEPVAAGDPCGAGDCFAAAAAAGLATGFTVREAVIGAVDAAADWVRSGGAAAFRDGRMAAEQGVRRPRTQTVDPTEAALAAVAATRARGGTVVATAGCFDVLHVGHLQSLRHARGLGDSLVVLLTSDASVRRLKSPARPVVPEQDRAAVLMGLAAVDGVIIFDEDGPRAVLEPLRPDVWAKGEDYSPDMLPEASLVRSWGGRVAVLPHLAGRSTMDIVDRITTLGATGSENSTRPGDPATATGRWSSA